MIGADHRCPACGIAWPYPRYKRCPLCFLEAYFSKNRKPELKVLKGKKRGRPRKVSNLAKGNRA